VGSPSPAVCYAQVPSYAYNVEGPSTTAGGDTLPGAVAEIAKLLTHPHYADPTLYVEQDLAATGGVTAFLDLLGADRGIDRQLAEPDAAYRARLRQLPDVVTPGAIKRALAAVWAPYGATCQFIEQWSPYYQTCYDMPSNLTPLVLNTMFVPDDPRDPTPFRGRTLGALEQRGAFIAWCPRVQPILDYGMVFDDPGMSIGDLRSAFAAPGYRALSAPDLTGQLYGAGAPACCVDGTDVGLAAAYAGVYALIQAVKAAGIYVALEREGN
jgi:hypothetical protein